MGAFETIRPVTSVSSGPQTRYSSLGMASVAETFRLVAPLMVTVWRSSSYVILMVLVIVSAMNGRWGRFPY